MSRFYVFDTEDFHSRYAYGGNDLGYSWNTKETIFKLWAPMADDCRLALYGDGHLGGPIHHHSMTYSQSGVWQVTVTGNLEGCYYNFCVCYDGKWNEVCDPYAKAAGVNGLRCMVVDFSALNPSEWEADSQRTRISPDRAVIYEAHIRDLTINENAGAAKRGLFSGLAEHHTVNHFGMPTGLDYLSGLGVTHIHLLPVNDFMTVDEFSPGRQYNWGYDPQHFSVLEGSYATNPLDGKVRIKEFKELIQELHKAGIHVILDVVYNHTYLGTEGSLYKVFPGYYHRTDKTGKLTNGSGCGNELATERVMVRKMILDSILFWAKEYHIDGFRLDLMGLYDLDTLRCIREELDRIDPFILMYGEPWMGGESSLDRGVAGIKENLSRLPSGIGAFSDDIRDAIKGDVFQSEVTGFVHGNINCRESVKLGIAGACRHPQVNPAYLLHSSGFWANSPLQSVNYVSSHDNYTLYDKLRACEPDADPQRICQLVKLSAAILFTSQGIPFFSEGEEFLRTKQGDHNSYRSGDEINGIDWDRCYEYQEMIAYYQGLIKLRKRHPAFRMQSAEAIQSALVFQDTDNNKVITYFLQEYANGDTWRHIAVVFNASEAPVSVELPCKGMNVVVDGTRAGTDTLGHIADHWVEVPSGTAMVLVI